MAWLTNRVHLPFGREESDVGLLAVERGVANAA
jgi:hypothetical protein